MTEIKRWFVKWFRIIWVIYKNELSQLPTKKAIVLGSVVTVPTIVDITELPQEKRPKSDTPSFWGVWTGAEKRKLDWKPIVNSWQQIEVEGDQDSDAAYLNEDE